MIGKKGGTGTQALLLMGVISGMLLLAGFKGTSSSFLSPYVDVSDNNTQGILEIFPPDSDFTEGNVSATNFDVDVNEEIKGNVTDLQQTNVPIVGGLFSFIDTATNFVTKSVAILGIFLGTPFDFFFSLGLPSAVTLTLGVFIFMALLIAILNYFTGRDF